MTNPYIFASSPYNTTTTSIDPSIVNQTVNPTINQTLNSNQPSYTNQSYYNNQPYYNGEGLYYRTKGKPTNRGYKQRELTGVGTETTLGFNSFIFGFIFGIILILIILIVLYSFRGLFFANVPIDYSICTNTDYYNDPAIALAQTELNARDILYVQDGTLFYKRVPSTRTCTPGPDQTVPINYPQYCLFERTSNNNSNNANLSNNDLGNTINDEPPAEGVCNINLGIGKTSGPAPHNTQASYQVDMWQTNVSATDNCRPVSGAELGRPLARWDPFP